MLADFIITIPGKHERSVRVVVHPTTRALRAAATRMDRVYGIKSNDNTDTVGLCHRFEGRGDDLVALIRLAPPYTGIGVVSHELAHAAVWIRELNEGGETPLTCDNDESFCWILGELVSRTVTKMYEHEIY